jgi:osmotically-inducible protein OsmY
LRDFAWRQSSAGHFRQALRNTIRAAASTSARCENKVARSVVGVRDVEDELSVDPRDRTEDDELRGLALQALMSNGRVPADRIEATVANGWLTLKGEVKHQSLSDAAFDAGRRLPGIGGITNKIVVITAGIDG